MPGRFLRLLPASLCVIATVASAQEARPLKAGVAVDPPFVVAEKDGRLAGFTIDLFRAVAARMKRDIVFTLEPAEALPGDLASDKFDLLPGPIGATPERAAEMLFTEGYMWSEYQFGAKRSEPVNRLEDLRGRRLAVETGSPYAEWAGRNAERYDFTTRLYSSPADTVAAVLHGEADASLTDSAVQRAAAAHDSLYDAGLSLSETRTHESAAFQKADTELRDEAEEAMHCLKQDGTLDRLSRTWFGTTPGQEDLENLVIPGYGVPGLAGYDPKPRKLHC
jgi:polar amino acid transport system substrate-binding protein